MPDDDLTDLETQLGKQSGLENHPHGFALLRLMRLVKQLAARVKALEDARTR